MARWSSCALVVLGLAVVSGASVSAQAAAAQPATAPASVDAGLAALYARLEQALVAGEPSQILAATSAAATNGDRLSAFAQSQAFARAVRAVIRERDRAPLEDAAEGSAYRMLLEVFVEYEGGRGGGADVVDRRDPDAGGRRLAPRRRRGAQLGGRPQPPRARSEPAVPRPRSRGPRRGSPAHVPERRRLRRVDRGRRDRRWSSSATARCSSRPRRRWSGRSCASSPARPSCARRSAPPSSAITRSIATIASAAR